MTADSKSHSTPGWSIRTWVRYAANLSPELARTLPNVEQAVTDLEEQLEALHMALTEIAGNHGRCDAGHVGMARVTLAMVDAKRPPEAVFEHAREVSSPASNPRHSDRSYTPNVHD